MRYGRKSDVTIQENTAAAGKLPLFFFIFKKKIKISAE